MLCTRNYFFAASHCYEVANGEISRTIASWTTICGRKGGEVLAMGDGRMAWSLLVMKRRIVVDEGVRGGLYCSLNDL